MPRSRDGRWLRTCEVCGDQFHQRKPGQRTCSLPKPCRARLPHNTGGVRAKTGLKPRTCQNRECGKQFQPVRETQIACTPTCYRKTDAWQQVQQRQDARPERRDRQNERRRLDGCTDPEYRRFLNMRSNMRHRGADLTLEQYLEWRVRQDGCCKLCRREVSGKGAHADHDHATGQLRDLLCGTCNQGLGSFKDSPELLRAAADYIERHRAAALAAVP